MADQNGYRGGPPPEESAYPPPPGEEEEDRQRQVLQYPPPPSAPHVTLPPIQDDHPAYGRFVPAAPQDPRAQGHYAASPPGANGHAPPPAPYQLPPVQPPPDQRYGVEPRYEYQPPGRGGSYPPPGPPPEHYNYTYRAPSQSPYASGPYEYPRAPSAPTQAAPRQRTSIACSYCRRRKIRCSGYGTSDGVCSNCRKTGNKCVFQPVSNSTTTAFVPVSAIPGGVAPGTPLYGAFGQPLPQGPGAAPQGAHPGPMPPLPPGAQASQGYPPHQGQPDGYQGHSPRTSYYPPPPEDANGRRRQHDDDHGSRLPPPAVYGDPDPRRRSPASPMQGTTPPQAQYEYPPNSATYEQSDRTGGPRRDSPPSPQQGNNAGPMSLNALIDGPPPRAPPNADSNREIDQNMLSRLNRRT